MASSLFTIGIGLPALLMPTIGGEMYDYYGGGIDGAEFQNEER